MVVPEVATVGSPVEAGALASDGALAGADEAGVDSSGADDATGWLAAGDEPGSDPDAVDAALVAGGGSEDGVTDDAGGGALRRHVGELDAVAGALGEHGAPHVDRRHGPAVGHAPVPRTAVGAEFDEHRHRRRGRRTGVARGRLRRRPGW